MRNLNILQALKLVERQLKIYDRFIVNLEKDADRIDDKTHQVIVENLREAERYYLENDNLMD